MSAIAACRRILALTAFAAAAAVAPASAQRAALPAASSGNPSLQTASRAPSGAASRWEIEGAAGVGTGWISSGGTALPAPGPPIATSSPIFPSRAASSWLFGDGATLLNGTTAAFGLTEQVQPLDSALQALGLDTTGLGLSFRARRTMTPRLSLEVSVDLLSGSVQVSDALLDAANATRDSARAAIGALLATGPFTNVGVDASSSTDHGGHRDIITTGALVWRLRSTGGWTPYVIGGGGVFAGVGDLPSITIEDSYHASILGSVPIAESDRVVLHYERPTRPIGVVGGGLRRVVSDRWGWQVDARVFLGGQSPRLLLDATPSVTTGTPAGFIESFTNPAVQFSNNPSTGRQSTLSGAPIRDFEAVGAGRDTRVLVTIGIFRRF